MQSHFYLSLASGMDGLFLALEELPLVLLGVCLLLLLLQLYYVLFVHGKLAFYQVNKQEALPAPDQLVPLSIVICARNDEQLLADNLPAVLEQDYPSFEVIV